MESSEPFSTHRAEIAPGIFLVTVSGAPSLEEFTGFLEGMAQWLDKARLLRPKISIVVDPSELTRFDANMRQAYGQWRGNNRALIAESCDRAAYVAHDKLWRGILTAVFWVSKPAIPVKLCESREASVDWLSSQTTD